MTDSGSLTLHIVGINPSAVHVSAILAVRSAAAALGNPEMSMTEADRLLDAVRGGEPVLLGSHDDEATLIELVEALGAAGVEARIDLDVGRWRAQEMTAGGATPEDVFGILAPGTPPDAPGAPETSSEHEDDKMYSLAAYRTAMTLLGAHDGNPLVASANARQLGYATDDAGFYLEVVGALRDAFPHLEQHLRREKIEWA